MGFSLPDTSLPYPPPPPPNLTVLMGATIEASVISAESAPVTNFTRCFMVLIGNIKGEVDRGNVLEATEDIYITSNPEIIEQIYSKGSSISFSIGIDKSISMYIWTGGSELKDAVQLKDLHLSSKKLTFSYVEIIQ